MLVLGLLVPVFAYSALYAIRFIKVNCAWSSKHVKASELPKECLSELELLGDPPEEVGVWVTRRDLDGDGVDELVADAGDNGRGAANSWYTIWKKQPSGKYACIGSYFCDWCLFVPCWLIYGAPGIFCVESTGAREWVPWKDGRYSCKMGNEGGAKGM